MSVIGDVAGLLSGCVRAFLALAYDGFTVSPPGCRVEKRSLFGFLFLALRVSSVLTMLRIFCACSFAFIALAFLDNVDRTKNCGRSW